MQIAKLFYVKTILYFECQPHKIYRCILKKILCPIIMNSWEETEIGGCDRIALSTAIDLVFCLRLFE